MYNNNSTYIYIATVCTHAPVDAFIWLPEVQLPPSHDDSTIVTIADVH